MTPVSPTANRGKPAAQWVRVVGLQSEAGAKLNGKVGSIVGTPNGHGRVPVVVDGAAGKTKLIKPENIAQIDNAELAQVCRISASGEHRPVEVLLYPRDHTLFSSSASGCACKVMSQCDVPLVVAKTDPVVALSRHDRGQWDCQMATWLMIEPANGFAPMEWQSWVGPVLVYRPGGLDFGLNDFNLVFGYVSKAIDYYGDGDFDPNSYFNPEAFQQFKRGAFVDSDGSALGLPPDVHI